MNIKDIVKGTTTKFLYVRHNIMYYTVDYEGVTYKYPVPLEDIGDATLDCELKAITLMRYIRQAIVDKTFVKVSK